MKLKDIIKGVKVIKTYGNLEVEIDNLSQSYEGEHKDSTLLFCFVGKKFDAHDLVKEKLPKGVTALVVERELDVSVPQIVVKHTRKVMVKMCNNFFGNVLKKLTLVGVTGTNGKTTTANLIYQMLIKDGKSAGVLGTIGAKVNGEKLDTTLTTPDTVPLFYLLNEMSGKGAKYVVMECSAHGIALDKIYGMKFEVGAFTNLTHDHLDYFKTMGNYALTKLKFLKKNYCKNVVINIDDKYGQMFSSLTNATCYTYGITNPARCFAMDVNYSSSGQSFVANILDNVFDVKTNLACSFNTYNTLCAMTCAKLLGVDNDSIYKTLLDVEKIDGRVNFYPLKNGGTAVIDFAHTPDAMENVLRELKKMCKGKLFVVFGCGGNRDRLKRSKMGNIAEIYADKIYITNDNPRFESQESIFSAIVSGIRGDDYVIEPNRALAINLAVNEMKPLDILAVLGKGGEDTMEICGHFIPYSDEVEICRYL